MNKQFKKAISVLMLALLLAIAVVGCGGKLSGTYSCDNQMAMVSSLQFKGSKAIVNDMGLQVTCSYTLENEVLEMHGSAIMLGTEVALDYEYDFKQEGDSIFLDGVEYKKQ